MTPGPYVIRGLLAAVAIVAVGVALSVARTSPSPEGEMDATGRFRVNSILGGQKLQSSSTEFRGGEASTFLGGIELDLRNAVMAGDEAVVEVGVVMGGVKVRVPEDWVVVADLTPILGGVKNRTQASDPAAPRLVLEGTIFMGGLDIGN